MTRVECINEHSIYRGHKGTVLSWPVVREASRDGGDIYDYTAAYALVCWDHNKLIALVGIGDLMVRTI